MIYSLINNYRLLAGNGTLEQEILSSSIYYIALANLNFEEVEVTSMICPFCKSSYIYFMFSRSFEEICKSRISAPIIRVHNFSFLLIEQ